MHKSAYVRHILRIELCKFLGCLRTGDSIHMNTLDFRVNKFEKVIEGRTAKTKSTEQTSGRLIQGMYFRLPLLPSLGDTWYKSFITDAVELGIQHGMGFIIPKDERAVAAGLPVHIVCFEILP